MCKEGSAVKEGHVYQNVLGSNLPCHRDRSDFRGQRITEITDVIDKTILDLGCNVGTISQALLHRGAKKVVAMDYDSDAIRIGKDHYPDVEFVEANIDLETIRNLPYYDIIVWTSQFMWFVKQHGWVQGLEALRLISSKCTVLVFETAGLGDGSAPLNLLQTDVITMLINNTMFQDIIDSGPWTDALENWSVRNVFVCQSPFQGVESDLSAVSINNDLVVTKDYSVSKCPGTFTREVKDREVLFLKKLSGFPYVPKLVNDRELSFDMSYGGIKAKWIPENQLVGILEMLKLHNITHRDIKPDNILWNGTNIVIIDWSWAVFDGELTNHSHDLGGSYKCPLGFNDEYSLRKVQREL